MEMREIILVAMCLAIGPLMVISDGGIETDYRLRAAVLETISEKTSLDICCLLYTSPSPRDRTRSRMPSSA